MKTYLLIAGYYCYPDRSTGDWVECFKTEDDAIEAMDGMRDSGDDYDWYDIVDLKDWIYDS